MRRISRLLPLLALVLLSACAPGQGGRTIVGGAVGGALGGAACSQIGGDPTTRLVAGIGCAIIGSGVGAWMAAPLDRPNGATTPVAPSSAVYMPPQGSLYPPAYNAYATRPSNSPYAYGYQTPVAGYPYPADSSDVCREFVMFGTVGGRPARGYTQACRHVSSQGDYRFR